MKYEFSESVSKKVKEFEKYLEEKRYSPGTIVGYKTRAGVFLQWLAGRNEEIEEANYHTIKDFIISLKEGSSIKQINYTLIAVKHYYNYQKLELNPILGIQQKGANKSLKHYFVDYEEVEEIYEDYGVKTDRDFRNKVMLGLMIYQGIIGGELSRLEVNNVELKRGKLEVSGYRKSKRRVLELASVQLLDLQEYLLKVRPRMLRTIKKEAAEKYRAVDPKIEERLFFGLGGSVNLKDSLKSLFKVVEKMNRKVSSGKVIRSTLIIHWLKHHDIRQVQYMAGHNFVSTTERYQAFNFKELEDELRNFHPLK